MENKQKKAEINLERRMEEWQHKAEDYLAGWQRAKADFINYKKRQDEATMEFKKYIEEDFILEILPVLDNFNEALKHIPGNEAQSEWIQGIMQIKKQIEDFLRQHGIQEIKTFGEKFNPEFHESIEITESDRESGTILEEGRKGYTLHEKVIRAAKVKVAK